MERLPFDPYDFFGYLASGLVLLVGMDIVLGFPHIVGVDVKPLEAFMLLLAAYVAGQINATPAKALLEDVITVRVLGRPTLNLMRDRKPRLARWVFPGFFVALPASIRSRITSRARAEGLQNPLENPEALFLHVRFLPETRADGALMRRLDSFRDRYGFARNLAFASLLVGAAILARWFVRPEPDLLKYAVTGLVAALLLFQRYLKFFRQYSFELFNSYGAGKQ